MCECVYTQILYIYTLYICVCVCVCVCVCLYDKGIYFKELPDAIIEAGKSKILGASWQAGAPGKS